MKDIVGLHDDHGFSSVTFILMMLVLVLAVGAISVDLWHLVAEHQEVAGVVDGAAIAAASAIDEGALRLDPPLLQIDADQAVARACSYLQVNGDAGLCPGPDARVIVGTYTVSVTMRRDVDLTLLRIFSGLDPDVDTSPIEVGATSTAAIATR